jgi:serine/threonine protein kinase
MKVKKGNKKDVIQHLSQGNEWIVSFLKETMKEKVDIKPLHEVLIMYSQFLERFIKNEIQIEELKKVELTTSQIFFPKYRISNLSVNPNQKINEGKKSEIFNLQNNTLVKEESIVIEPNSSIQHKEIHMFHSFKESLIQYLLYHKTTKHVVPNLLFLKTKENKTQIRMQKIDGISFYQFIKENIQNEKLIIQKMMDIALLLEELQTKFHFVHGDLHCKNIMITPNGIVFIDFGLSCMEVEDGNQNFFISVVEGDSRLMYIPDNEKNYSKSLDLFYMFVGIYRYIYENEFPESSKLLNLIHALFDIPHTQINFIISLFDYIKKYEYIVLKNIC